MRRRATLLVPDAARSGPYRSRSLGLLRTVYDIRFTVTVVPAPHVCADSNEGVEGASKEVYSLGSGQSGRKRYAPR